MLTRRFAVLVLTGLVVVTADSTVMAVPPVEAAVTSSSEGKPGSGEPMSFASISEDAKETAPDDASGPAHHHGGAEPVAGPAGVWQTMVHGYAFLNFNRQGGP